MTFWRRPNRPTGADVDDRRGRRRPASSNARLTVKTVKEVTDSTSEIVYEALPVDDPKQRKPDIALARELLGWSPEVSLRDGLALTIEQSGVELLVGGGSA